MDETRELIEAARDQSKKNDVINAVKYLAEKNMEENFGLFKDIFFHPLTNHSIRLEVGSIIASTKNKQVYNLLISHLVLRNFSDIAAIIFTLGEYKEPTLYDVFLREYPTCNFDAQMEIIHAISKIKSEHSIDFFSKVFNGEIKSANLTDEQTNKLKQVAGEALQKQVIDF